MGMGGGPVLFELFELFDPFVLFGLLDDEATEDDEVFPSFGASAAWRIIPP